MYRKLVCVLILVIAQVTVAVTGGAYLLAGQVGDTVLPGISVEDIPLGGMTAKEARAVLQKKLGSASEKRLRVVAGNRTWEIPHRKLEMNIEYRQAVNRALEAGHTGGPLQRGLEALAAHFRETDLPLHITYNENVLARFLEDINHRFSRKSRNARIRWNDGVEITPGEKGRSIDIKATVQRIEARHMGLDGPVFAVVTHTPPDVRESDLKKINGVLAETETTFERKDGNRVKNIKLAAARINDVFLPAGEVFSFNTRVGERKRSKGYTKAPVLSNGSLIPGLGGGICQVSTTLYDAALLAGLEIVERHPHSRAVSYVSPGLDATVVYGEKDFKFKNSLPGPVYITSRVKKNRLIIKILGPLAFKKWQVKLLTNVERIPPNMVVKQNSSLDTGERKVVKSGSPGFRADVSRIFLLNSREIRKEHLSSDYYPPVQRIVLEGPDPGGEELK